MHIICTAASRSAVLALAEGVLIANAIHTVPERLAFLIVEKNGECELREWQSQLRLQKLGKLLSHRAHLGEGQSSNDCAVLGQSTQYRELLITKGRTTFGRCSCRWRSVAEEHTS
jgi:hypothetical protein